MDPHGEDTGGVHVAPVDTGPRRELRVALSMNGGVSLAVWIGGAVCEVDRVRGAGDADPFWTRVLEACGYLPAARIDVMTGASAGGLNAVLLARSIRHRVPFETFARLWRERADIDVLAKGPRNSLDEKNDPRAVLRGEYFLEQVEDALRAVGDADTAFDDIGDLALFASATLIEPNGVAYTDAPGAPICEPTSAAYFHVARRGSRARGLDGFAVTDLDGVLGRIGRSTSSIPGLFEPMRFVRTAADLAAAPESRSYVSRSWLVGAFTHDRRDVEIMDGGVVDNVPIARAIRAIYTSRATTDVRRVLLYLHPDPGGRCVPDPTPKPNALRVVRSFFGKRSESLREDIDLLRSHNEAVVDRRSMTRVVLESLPTSAGATSAVPSDPPRTSVEIEAEVALLVRAASSPRSEMGWHAFDRPAVLPLTDGNVAVARDELDTALRELFAHTPDVLAAERLRREAATLEQLLWMTAPSEQFTAVAPALELLSDAQLLAEMVTAFQLSRFMDAQVCRCDAGAGAHLHAADAVARLVESRRTLDAFTVDSPMTDADWASLAAWDLDDRSPRASTVPAALTSMIDEALRTVVATWPAEQPAPGSPGDDDRELAVRALRLVGAGHAQLTALALALVPVHSDSSASLQHIDFLRIAGDAPSPAADAFAAVASRNGVAKPIKIAGTQLHHLGAFFAPEWRTNDWRWGQLDAVPTLVDAVLDDDALDRLRARIAADPGLATGLGLDGLAPAADRAAVRDALVRHRQGELLAAFFELDGRSFDAIVADAAFARWSGEDRHLLTKLGRQQLTGVGMRGVLTASSVLRRRLGPVAQLLVEGVLRPIAMGLAGLFLTGRWGVASLAWTTGALAMPRSTSTTQRIAWLVVIALSVVVPLWFTELKLKLPDRRHPFYGVVPLVLTAAGVAIGVATFWACVRRWLAEPVGWPVANLSRGVWLAGLAAAIAASCISWWIRKIWWLVFTVVIFGWYFAFARAAYVHAQGPDTGVAHWPDWWTARTMWVAWLVAVIASPHVFSRMTDKALGATR